MTSHKVDILLGLQWGDEGKGKIVDVLTPRYDVVARFQGGPNAGHTLEFDGRRHVLHTVPSGIFHDHVINLIGNGVVIDPRILAQELAGLDDSGVDFRKRLLISRRAHLILPTHRLLDAAMEADKGASRIGSTLKGIGPAYSDKTGRTGLRVGDLFSDTFREKYDAAVSRHRRLLDLYNFQYDPAEHEDEWMAGVGMLRSLQAVDGERYLHEALNSGKKVLAEGAQGAMLDIDFGSYPFVTSSSTIAAGACTGLGVPPNRTGRVFGIFKAYCTRVGSGPFPTELDNAEGETMRRIGREYGSTTGRSRRCGWIDLPALRYACMINGVTDLFMMKADVLSVFDTIRICTHYNTPEGQSAYPPPDLSDPRIEPVYHELPGWGGDLTSLRTEAEIPGALRNYIHFLESELQVPIPYVSVGPDRTQTILRQIPGTHL
jgi:adenylosuccinate synthase